MVMSNCGSTRKHWLVDFPWVNYVVCELELDKEVLKTKGKRAGEIARDFPEPTLTLEEGSSLHSVSVLHRALWCEPHRHHTNT